MLSGGGGARGGRPPLPPKKTMSSSSSYASIGRTSSGRFVSLSQDDLDMSGELGGYTVQIPSTPDNQPMDPLRAAAEQQHASNTLYSGGSDMGVHGQPTRKMTDGESNHPQLSGRAGGLNCSIDGCDGLVIRNERGEFLSPCDCEFKICRDCYHAARGTCPSCKHPYKYSDEVEESMADSIPPGDQQLKHTKSQLLMKNQNSDLDSSPWLYETKGSYGYDNTTWTEDDPDYNGGGGDGGGSYEMGSLLDPKDLAKRPLSRVINIRPGILIPYRMLVVIRFVALGFFLTWRIRNPNNDAIWLWGMSIVCEIWFAFSWILDQMPKLNPVRRTSDLNCLRDKFESRTADNPTGKSDLPGIDVFVSTADPEKEPPLTTANTILSILASDYPVDKLSCYLSDDGGALATFEALAEAASFAMHWIPFCRKHNIEPRNPEAYYNMKGDPTKNKVRPDFVKDRRRLKREYDEFKVRINSLPDSIRRRSDAYNAHEEIKARRAQLEGGGDPYEPLKLPNATWMADGTHWPGTWIKSAKEHSRGDHAGIIQVMLSPPSNEPLFGSDEEEYLIDTTDVDTRLPLLVYVSREKHAGYDHNKKAGAMNALVRSSAILSNGSFMLNLDCDHYIYNSTAMREGICFMLDKGGENICYVQFPQRFEGIDTHDRYANHNTVFFDCNMRALDGLQGPMYVGTGCLFRRVALYGFKPPNIRDGSGGCCGRRKKKLMTEINTGEFIDEEMAMLLIPKRFGNSNMLLDSIPRAEINGRPLADHAAVKYGRKPGTLIDAREPLDAARLAESISVISCWYEDKTEWGNQVGWIYGSVTEDVLTGYCMHKKGWRSVYCVTARDAFRGTAPINLTDRLHQVLRWATGSVEIFFSRNNGLLAGPRMKILQQIAYLNVGIYPFTSIFLVVYCFLPALSLYTNQFIVANLSVTFLVYLLIITITLCLLAILEVRWSGITLEEWWRNEQFWLIGGTSAHLAAVFQGLLKVVAGIDVSFTLTAKAAADENEDDFAELYEVKWTSLMIPPIVIMMMNIIGIAIGFARTIYSPTPEWSKLLGGSFFALWVLMHLYPFAKGLMGRRGRTPTIVWVWSGLLSITISLLWVAISNPGSGTVTEGQIQIP